MAHYFPYDVKLRLLAHSRSFLANQKARNAIVGAENLLISDIPQFLLGDIRSHDAFRPIARERKELMDYNARYRGKGSFASNLIKGAVSRGFCCFRSILC